MKRLIIVLVAVGLLVAGSCSVLLFQALDGIERHRSLSHRLVAERFFKACERQLSVFVQREENRPYNHYRYFYVPTNQVPGSQGVSRSPLADGPQDKVVLGYYQMDPNGRIHSPTLPNQPELAQNIYNWNATSEQQARCFIVGEWTLQNREQLVKRIDNPQKLDNFLACTSFEVGNGLPGQLPPQLAQSNGHASNVPHYGQGQGHSQEQGRPQQVDPALVQSDSEQASKVTKNIDVQMGGMVQETMAELRQQAEQQRKEVQQREAQQGKQVVASNAVDESLYGDNSRNQLLSKGKGGYLSRRDNKKRKVSVPYTSAQQFQANDLGLYNNSSLNYAPNNLGQNSNIMSSSVPQQTALQTSGANLVQLPQNQVASGPSLQGQEGLQRRSIGAADHKFEGWLNGQFVPASPDGQAPQTRIFLPQAQAADDTNVAKAIALYDHISDHFGNQIPTENLTVTIASFIGKHMVDSQHMLLRSVEIGESQFLQGMVVDLAALTRSLETKILDDSDLGGVASMNWSWPGKAGISEASQPDHYLFTYEFGEPFAGLRADLVLPPMQDGHGYSTGVLLGFTGLIAAALFFGFWSVGRMVATRMAFARRRNDFVSAVSHELRTPLTSIRMYAEMLRDGMVFDDERRQKYYGTITAEGERLSRLVDNVLELSRIERGEDKDPDMQVGRMDEVLDELLQILEPAARSKGFSLKQERPEDLPSCSFDRDALLQVLLNLADNSMKFARDAERKELVFRLQQSDGNLQIQVMDYGPGVPAKHLSKICEPFYRAESELTRTTKGTGIGLALVDNLIRRMGGQFQVANHEAGGFVATIQLPAQR